MLNKNFFNFLFGFAGILAVGFLVLFAVRFYEVSQTSENPVTASPASR